MYLPSGSIRAVVVPSAQFGHPGMLISIVFARCIPTLGLLAKDRQTRTNLRVSNNVYERFDMPNQAAI